MIEEIDQRVRNQNHLTAEQRVTVWNVVQLLKHIFPQFVLCVASDQKEDKSFNYHLACGQYAESWDYPQLIPCVTFAQDCLKNWSLSLLEGRIPKQLKEPVKTINETTETTAQATDTSKLNVIADPGATDYKSQPIHPGPESSNDAALMEPAALPKAPLLDEDTAELVQHMNQEQREAFLTIIHLLETHFPSHLISVEVPSDTESSQLVGTYLGDKPTCRKMANNLVKALDEAQDPVVGS